MQEWAASRDQDAGHEHRGGRRGGDKITDRRPYAQPERRTIDLSRATSAGPRCARRPPPWPMRGEEGGCRMTLITILGILMALWCIDRPAPEVEPRTLVVHPYSIRTPEQYAQDLAECRARIAA